MEPPDAMANSSLQDQKVKVLRGIKTLGPSDVVRGQFKGYRNEPGVKPDSIVETYVALRLQIDSPRWKGVPFYIRAGKSLPVTVTEVKVMLRQPRVIFSQASPAQNYVRFRVTPDLAIAIGGQVKKPGDEMKGEPVELLATQNSDPAELSAYQELLNDAIHGDASHFAREDYVEEAWRIVQPVLDNATPLHFYDPGTLGPSEADKLVSSDTGWQNPK